VPRNAHEVGPSTPVPVEAAILHYGYATPELRRAHHAAYMARREHLTELETLHAKTILDERPQMLDLPVNPRWPLL